MNGSNECSTSSSENTPPDKNGQIMPGGTFFISYFFKRKKEILSMGILLNLDVQTILGTVGANRGLIRGSYYLHSIF